MRIFAQRKSLAFIVLIALISTNYVASGNCCDSNIISVSGDSTVSIQPDIAKVSVGISVTEKTSQLATSGVASKIQQINQILTQNGINKKDRSTQRLSIFPKYDYNNGRSEVVGQTASQTLDVTVRDISQSGQNVATLIDALVSVDGIQLNSLSFDKEDKTEAQNEARKLAFENAKTKATEYAQMAGRRIGRVVTIIDGASNQGYYPQPIYRANSFAAPTGGSTSVAVSDVDVRYNVDVKFSLY